MATISRIFVTTNAEHADQTLGLWNNQAGFVACAGGPVDKIELTTAESDTLLWQSDGEEPFYVILATPRPTPSAG